MLSSNGRAIPAPKPRKTVRRERDFFVMNILNSYLAAVSTSAVRLIWNGSLETIPRMSDSQR
jgi:hypothetical protein